MPENALTTLTLTLDGRDEATLLFGNRDQYLRLIRDALGVRIVARGDILHIEGTEEQVGYADRVFQQLRVLLTQQGSLSLEDVRTILSVVQGGGGPPPAQNLTVVDKGRHVRPRTDGQGRYIAAMRENDVVLCVGPAGTGKTYLAVGMAVTALRQAAVKKIVLVRPAVEAVRSSATCPATSWPRSTPTCGRCSTPSTTCLNPSWSSATWIVI